MENLKLKSQIVIFPNPNQLILLRKIQKELCKEGDSVLPLYPICLKCKELKGLNDKITKSDVQGFYIEEKKICLSVALEINGKEAKGYLELCESNEESQNQIRFDIPFTKISPFRIVEMKSQESEKGLEWKVSREKWVKIL